MSARSGRAARTLAVLAVLTLSATGCGAGTDGGGITEATSSTATRAAIQQYRALLERNAAALVSWVAKLRDEVIAGNLTRAQSHYATARVEYGQLQPLAGSFDDLEARIDATAADGPAAQLTGFHRLERALFAESTTVGADRVAERLLADVRELRRRLAIADLQAQRIARDTSRTMLDLSGSEVAGEEERYSHIDLVDIAATSEGAEAAFETVAPLLSDASSEDLRRRIEAQLDAVFEGLQPFGSAAREPQARAGAAGARFVPFTELAPADIRSFALPIERLGELLAQVPARIAGS